MERCRPYVRVHNQAPHVPSGDGLATCHTCASAAAVPICEPQHCEATTCTTWASVCTTVAHSAGCIQQHRLSVGTTYNCIQAVSHSHCLRPLRTFPRQQLLLLTAGPTLVDSDVAGHARRANGHLAGHSWQTPDEAGPGCTLGDFLGSTAEGALQQGACKHPGHEPDQSRLRRAAL
jgi:hypothetical protein